MTKMHPIAEAALRAAGKAGRKAIERAAVEGITSAVDSVLEDVEKSTGGISSSAREVRDRIQTRKEEAMGRRKAAREEEDLREDEDEDEAPESGEEEEDEEEDEDTLLLDAEVMIRNAIYILEAGAEEDKSLRKLARKAGELHEELVDRINDE